MCGVAGSFRPGGMFRPGGEAVLRRQSDRLQHRGPDDSGAWLDSEAGIALGHRRLAIIDPSSAGKQPMLSASSRYVIAYNGEIYNHLEIRAELEAADAAPVWRGHSDTETLLAGFDNWGIETALVRLSGMFAIAVWDRETRELTLARDRMGEKPLYYGWQGETFLFGSELKALRAHPAFCAEVNREALAELLRHGYIAAPASIYNGIRKLPAGCMITIAAHNSPHSFSEPRAYWMLRDVVMRGLTRPFAGRDDEAIARLDFELRRAVLQQTISDVPLGAFLSGGIDSTTVVALLQAQSTRRVQTFTIGFHEGQYQEAQHAAAVARHLGTEHSELYITAADAMNVIPKLSGMYDEPFGDSSAIPTHLVAQFAHRKVTVCLSGDGGDELFGGYTRYQSTVDVWRGIQFIPRFARNALASGCAAYARSHGESQRGWWAGRAALYLAARNADECYAAKRMQWPQATELVQGYEERSCADARRAWQFEGGDIYTRMMYGDAMTYLPDDILAKVDRASMAVSLETRIPMLDPRVVEFAWSLPLRMKVRDHNSKWLLKRVLAKYVPDALMRRPKMGFGVPVGEWMRGPLRGWAEDLLAESRLKSDGFLKSHPIREQWSRHLTGAQDGGDSLWPVLMFQAWLAEGAFTNAAATA